jgi:tetratricopeptide (TPR) repeat protein
MDATLEEVLRTLRMNIERSGFPPLFVPEVSGTEEEGLLLTSYKHLVEGRFEKAIEGFDALRGAVKEDINSTALTNLIGYCHLEAGDHEAAKGAYMRAMGAAQSLDNIPIQLDALIGISVSETLLGEYSRARHIVLHGLVVSSGGHDVHLATLKRSLGFVERSANQVDDAVGPLTDALQLFEDAGDDIGAAWSLFELGGCHKRAGRFEEAAESYRSSADKFEGLQCMPGVSRSLIHLGSIEELRGNVEEGLEILRRALSIAEKKDYKPCIALALNNIGVIKYRRGEYDDAIETLTRANELAESIDDEALKSMSVNNLGNVYYDRGDLSLAKVSYSSAIQSQRLCQNEVILAGYLGNLGLVHLELGEFQKSVSSLEEAVFLFSEHNNTYGKAMMLSNLANVYNEVGKYRKAIDICQQALAISRNLNTPCSTAETLSNLGYANSRMGELERAGEAFTEALELISDIEEPITLSQILVKMASYQVDADLVEQAVATLERAQNVYRKLEQTNKIVYCQSLLASFYGMLGNAEEAGRFARSVETALEGMPDSLEKVKCALHAGSAYRMIEVPRKAFVLLRSAYLGFFTKNVLPGLVQSLGELGALAFDTGNFPQAAAYLTSAGEIFNTIDANPREKERINALLDTTRRILEERNLNAVPFSPENPPELD